MFVEIQLWNLGFVEAHHNSILRGQGFLSTRGGWKGHAAFPHRQLASKQSRRQKSAVHEQIQEKAVKRSSIVVAVVVVVVVIPYAVCVGTYLSIHC